MHFVDPGLVQGLGREALDLSALNRDVSTGAVFFDDCEALRLPHARLRAVGVSEMVVLGQVEFGQLLEHLHVHAGPPLVVDQVTRQ